MEGYYLELEETPKEDMKDILSRVDNVGELSSQQPFSYTKTCCMKVDPFNQLDCLISSNPVQGLYIRIESERLLNMCDVLGGK